MFSEKVVAAYNVSLRNPRRERQIVRCKDKREVKTEMSRKKKPKYSGKIDLAKDTNRLRGSITFLFR
jgi:hypothetical protein